jgi:hypothetical protein
MSNAPGGTCIPVKDKPLLIEASLTSPFPITPAPVVGPDGHDMKGCTAESKTPSWTLRGTQLNIRTVYGNDGASRSQSLTVQLINNVTGYITSCGGVSNGNDPIALSCFAQEPYRRQEKYQIQTNALFDTVNYNLKVNETWFCDDVDAATP